MDDKLSEEVRKASAYEMEASQKNWAKRIAELEAQIRVAEKRYDSAINEYTRQVNLLTHKLADAKKAAQKEPGQQD